MPRKPKKKDYQPRGGVPKITSEEVHEFLETLSPETLAKLNDMADAIVKDYKARPTTQPYAPFGRVQALELIMVAMSSMDYLSKDRVRLVLAQK